MINSFPVFTWTGNEVALLCSVGFSPAGNTAKWWWWIFTQPFLVYCGTTTSHWAGFPGKPTCPPTMNWNQEGNQKYNWNFTIVAHLWVKLLPGQGIPTVHRPFSFSFSLAQSDVAPLQMRLRMWFPVPQLMEQMDHSIHSERTTKERRMKC